MIAILVAVAGFISFVLGLIFYLATRFISISKPIAIAFSALLSIFNWASGGAKTDQPPIPAVAQVDCSGAKIPEQYLPTIKQAAARYLDGDQAKLIAVISFESGFNPYDISGTGAVGLGQFVVGKQGPVVLSHDFFQGLPITVVPRADKSKARKVTPAEKKAFIKNYPTSGRFNPEASIYATAHKLKIALKQEHGDFRQAYAIDYNGEEGDAKFQHADKVIAIYNRIKADGGCKQLSQPPGQLGATINKDAAKKK